MHDFAPTRHSELELHQCRGTLANQLCVHMAIWFRIILPHALPHRIFCSATCDCRASGVTLSRLRPSRIVRRELLRDEEAGARLIVTHSYQHPYSSYNSLGPAVPWPFLAKKCCFRSTRSENSTFRQETAEKRLDLTRDLTSYMSYANAEGRGSRSPTAYSIHIAHIAS